MASIWVFWSLTSSKIAGSVFSSCCPTAPKISSNFAVFCLAIWATIAAVAFSDPSHLTCIANDFGYDEVFAREVQAYGKQGDLLVAISTSGNSPNVLRAVEEAKKLGVRTVALLGKGGGKLLDQVDIPIIVPQASTSDRIQEIHIKVLHIAIEAVERMMFPENYS